MDLSFYGLKTLRDLLMGTCSVIRWRGIKTWMSHVTINYSMSLNIVSSRLASNCLRVWFAIADRKLFNENLLL